MSKAMEWNKIIGKLVDRWMAETPLIYKRVQAFAVSLSAIAIAVNTACVSAGATLPEWWVKSFPYMVGVGAAITAIAQFTKKKED